MSNDLADGRSAQPTDTHRCRHITFTHRIRDPVTWNTQLYKYADSTGESKSSGAHWAASPSRQREPFHTIRCGPSGRVPYQTLVVHARDLESSVSRCRSQCDSQCPISMCLVLEDHVHLTHFAATLAPTLGGTSFIALERRRHLVPNSPFHIVYYEHS